MGQLRIIDKRELEQHQTEASCWIVYQHHVYDITSFLQDHPGGPDLILEHLSKDLSAVMSQPDLHEHSESAYALLPPMLLGVYETHLPALPHQHQHPHPHPHLSSTSSTSSSPLSLHSVKLAKPFLDLDRPLFSQLLYGNFTKAFYLEQVHIPRHLPHPCTIFANPYLEYLTRTPWYVVPTVWLPFTMCLATLVPEADRLGAAGWVVVWVLGVLLWTFFEYTFHRCLFHVHGPSLPDHPWALTLHFLVHGIHHFLPMDNMRLVLPPVFFAALLVVPWLALQSLFPFPVAIGLLVGAIHGYIGYDVMHYTLHHAHTTDAVPYLKNMRSYHMAHHYKDAVRGFGITSKGWDYVFGTVG